MFGVGSTVMLIVWFFVKELAINCFWIILVVLRRTFKFYSSGFEKDQLGKCSRSTAAVAWAWMNAREAEAGCC